MAPMQTFAIDTLGCKVNQYETQQIREYMERLGLQPSRNGDTADLHIVNTCCVTHTASAKSRQYITRAVRRNPEAVVVVCGCLPTVRLGELPLDEHLEVVASKDDLPAALNRIVASRTGCSLSDDPRLPPLRSFSDHTRAFLKVQDGCDGHCTYCIVPTTRPHVSSRPTEEILDEARSLVEAGHKEIVLTGVFLGAYGMPTVRRRNWPAQQNDKLAYLLDRIARTPGLARIRLSSLEPADVTDSLLDVLANHSNIMPHLHLPLQSGSSRILKRMARQYTAAQFTEQIDRVRSRLDRPAITTDIIVGFPGETDADFEQTIAMARYAGFAKIHVFPFSPRKGTPACSMAGRLDPAVIRPRTDRLQRLGRKIAARFRDQFVGESCRILVENEVPVPAGRAERYFMVHIENAPAGVDRNDVVIARLVGNCAENMTARVEQPW